MKNFFIYNHPNYTLPAKSYLFTPQQDPVTRRFHLYCTLESYVTYVTENIREVADHGSLMIVKTPTKAPLRGASKNRMIRERVDSEGEYGRWRLRVTEKFKEFKKFRNLRL